jgi:UDP-galactopyranose mutase
VRRVLVVGAGLTGSTIARVLAENGYHVEIIDERDYVGGNCHTRRDPATGVMVHVHGPHIFHTDNDRVWKFVNRFALFKPYTFRTKTTACGKVYSLPLNLLTINQFFERALRPNEAREFVASLAVKSCSTPRNFEEQGLALLGEKLYRTFFEGYTFKQWGCTPRDLPASILHRLPLRFNYDDNYFSHRY